MLDRPQAVFPAMKIPLQRFNRTSMMGDRHFHEHFNGTSILKRVASTELPPLK